MLWLAGLMGMMVLGSLAVFGTHDSASDDAGDDVRPEDTEEVADEVSSAFGLPGMEFGDDLLYAHDGGGTLDGGDDADELQGGLGADSLLGGAGNDALHGREGADTLIGGGGEDTLFAGGGNDLLSGVLRDGVGTDTDALDYLNGSDGDDTLEIGAGDVATGGSGADRFALGDWIDEAEAAQLMDFDASEDQMLVIYDDSDDEAEPELELRDSDTVEGMVEIVLDGEVLATMPLADAPPLASIVLVGESAMPALGGL